MLRSREAADEEGKSVSFMEDVRVINRESGKNVWTLSAKRVDIFGGQKQTRLTAVTIDLPEHDMLVESASGSYDLRTHDLTLSGKTRAKTDDYVITTESVYVDPESGQLSSHDRVVLEGERFRVEGEGFEATSDRKVVFKRNVKATFF